MRGALALVCLSGLLVSPVALAAPGQPSHGPGQLIEKPLLDLRNDVREAFLYKTGSRGFAVEMFDRVQSHVAGARLAHAKSGTSLAFSLAGSATSRTATGHIARAQVGPITATWTSYADRLKEDLVVRGRPAGDAIHFNSSSTA